MSKQWVYRFEEGSEALRNLLGGKGAGLAEMTRIGLPVPPGFTITTEACIAYYEGGQGFPEGLWDQTRTALSGVEEALGKRFGDVENPLLLSVRSGARLSMPGMMDTVLDLGLNDETVRGLITQADDEHFAYDAYRRLIQMFGDVVLGVEGERFEEALEQARARAGVASDAELSAEALKGLVEAFQAIVQEASGQTFPQDPEEQLRRSIEAVFKSWNTKRAVDYRDHHGIPHDLGTGVNVQAMVFGNLGADSASGVAFTRNPATGEKVFYGEYLVNAQGEDVVSGSRTPQPIHKLKEDFPDAYDQLLEIAAKLEDHYHDMQDVEFTIQNGTLWMLQTRKGKRTSKAAMKVAVDMADEGLITREEAVLQVDPQQVERLLHPRFDAEALRGAELLAEGLNASPGAAVGQAVFDADTAEARGKAGEAVILVRPETTPDDVHGFLQSKGILTQRGGMTSHAAVVSRGLGIPAVVGCEHLHIDLKAKRFTTDGQTVGEGDVISLDGTTGRVYLGELPTQTPQLEDEVEFARLLEWADEFRTLGVRANADYPRDAQRAHAFGAEGIGLCRTEHMFFESERLPIVQKMILSRSTEERKAALDQLLPFQKEDFKGLLREMSGLPVIVRLIDPPLHEFLPRYEDLLTEVTELRAKGDAPEALAEKEQMLETVGELREANPMLGLRGVRLGLRYPEIVEMQVRALMTAACELSQEGLDPRPEIMIPLVSDAGELKRVRERLEAVADEVMAGCGGRVKYLWGTMIELPRACLVADELAERAEFFSFGTNDLTQTTYGISRDDAEEKFLRYYEQTGVFADPFRSLDARGVGELMRIAVERGRQTRPDIELGICGEHGGDPASIHICHKLGLDYVSCSPFRVPVARLAAAQAALEGGEHDV